MKLTTVGRLRIGSILIAIGWICPIFVLGGNFCENFRALFTYDSGEKRA